MIAGLVLLAGGAAVGLFGSLLGLGGGILLVPLLTLGFGRPLREAVAISLVSVIVTSSAGAGVYLRRHVANLRLGMVLELFTACGALAGGLIAFALPVPVLEGLFALLLGWVGLSMLRRGDPSRGAPAPAPAAAAAAEPVPAAEETAAVAPSGPSSPSVAIAPAGGGAAALTFAQPMSFAASLSGPGYQVGRLGLGAVGA